MDAKNNFVILSQPLCVRDALSDQVRRAAPEDKPVLERLPDRTVFAVFESLPNNLEVFLGLVTAEQVAANPSRVLADLLLKPPPPPLMPETPLEVALHRLEVERVGALPVVDEDGRFLGAVTLVSLLEALLRREANLRQEGLVRLEYCGKECERLKESLNQMMDLHQAAKGLLICTLEGRTGRAFLQATLELLCTLVKARYGALVVLDQQGAISQFVFWGIDEETAKRIGRLPQGTGILGPNVLGRKGSLRLANLAEHPQAAGFPEHHPQMRSLVAAQIAYQDQVLGRVYLCDRQDGEPFSAEDEREVKQFAELLALSLLERQRRQELDLKLKLAAKVFEQANEGILITDAEEKIVLVNRALTTITGYREQELLGKTPRIFQSGHQNREFYRAMWQNLEEAGQWQGEIWNRRKNGEVYPEWLSISALTDETGHVSHYVAVFSDLSQTHLERKGLERLVHFDHLTALPNRLTFRVQLKQAMLRTRFTGKYTALLMLDLDRFKSINDGLGHQVGDCLLQQVARRLSHVLRKQEAPRIGDIVARLSGDEFGIILNDLESPEDAENVAEKILGRFAEPFSLGKLERSVTASCGIAVYPGDAETIDELIRHADLALYHAKRLGRNRFCRYDGNLHAASSRRLMLENALYHALARGEFTLHYQPQVEISTGRVVGLEALLRWSHPEFGAVSPLEFIPLLEETGLIEEVGEWSLRQVLAAYPKLCAKFGGKLKVAVNISARQLNARLLAFFQAELAQSGIDPFCLELELTESAAMDDPEAAREILVQLKRLGVGICIDDFGTGYSSLALLTRLPVTGLKIDRSFVQNMMENPNDFAVVFSVIALACSLKLKVTAEGVETQAQYEKLKALRCDFAQGYLFGKPTPLEELKPLAFPIPS